MAGPIYSVTEYGLVFTCTGGTGSITVTSTATSGITPSMRICGAACGGSATADLIYICNGNAQGAFTITNTAGATYASGGTLFFSGVGATSGALAALNLGAVVRITTPIIVNFVGGTNGQAILYTPSQNA